MSSRSTACAMAVLLVVVGVPMVVGQSEPVTFVEDFESETVGDAPAGNFYTFYKTGGTELACFVTTYSLEGSSQAMRLLGSGSGGQTCGFTMNAPVEVSTMSWYMQAFNTNTALTFTLGGTSGNLFSSSIQSNTGNVMIIPGVLNFGDCPNEPLLFELVFNYEIGNIGWTVTRADGVTVCKTATTTFSTANAGLTSINFVRSLGNAVDIRLDAITIEGLGLKPPEAPAGLTATVTDGKETDDPAEQGTVELRWPVSIDDPDQSVGVFAYNVYLNGFDIGVDVTTSVDGDGVRYNQVVLAGNEPGEVTVFGIKATNTTSGLTSAMSCVVSVDTSVKGDTQTCGKAFPGSGIGGGLSFTTESDTAAGLQGFCADLLGDSSGSLFLCGLVFVSVVFLALAGSFVGLVHGNRVAAPSSGVLTGASAVGSMGAFGMMIFNVFSEIWSLVWGIVLIVLTAAVIMLMMRRLFGDGGE